MAGSALSLSSACMASVFPENSPLHSYFLHFFFFQSKLEKRNRRPDFGLDLGFLFWNSAHLGHYFVRTPKIIKFNRWSCSNWFIYCVNKLLREKVIKTWNQECKQKQSRMFGFCSVFYLLTYRTQKMAWWPLVFETDFHIFSYKEKLRKI